MASWAPDRPIRTVVGRIACLAIVATAASACSGDDGDDAVGRGRRTAIAAGCAACHGTDGQGGVGPTWIGLADSDVELEDGSVVVADDDYLVRSILDPAADIVPGFSVNMPTNAVSDDEALDIVAFIRSLGDDS